MSQAEISADLDLGIEETEKSKKARKLEEIKYKKNLRRCKSELRTIKYGAPIWLIIFLALCYAVYYCHKQKILEFTTEGVKKENFLIFFPCLALLLLISLIKVFSNSNNSKKIPDKGGHLREMPKHPTETLRELYVSMSCKRCVNYWICFFISWLCILAAAYCLVICGIEYGVKKGSPKFKLFQGSSYTQFLTGDYLTHIKNGDWSIKIPFAGLPISALVWIPYVLFRFKGQGGLYALEHVYGKEKIVNECLLGCRLNCTNRRYKCVVFVILCFAGCLFYLFFKRLICALFDKSFVV